MDEGSEVSVSDHTLHSYENNTEDVEITLYALSGTPTSGTMRVMGMIRHKSLVILIDSGSTYNFINTSLLP